jgi:hypothetical protein
MKNVALISALIYTGISLVAATIKPNFLSLEGRG